MYSVLIKSTNEQPSKSTSVRFHNAIIRGMLQFCNEELNDRYSPNINRVMKSGRWAGQVAYMGREQVLTGFWWGDLRKGNHLEDPGIDLRIILK